MGSTVTERRCRHEIYADILRSLPATRTTVLRTLPGRTQDKYIAVLIDDGLMQEVVDYSQIYSIRREVMMFTITEKGKKFLEIFEQLEKLVEVIR